MLIGISGKKCSGKDTMANILQNLFWVTEMQNFKVKHFADSLKAATKLLTGYDCETQEDKLKEISWLNKMTIRQFLQTLGSAVRANIDEDFWIKCTFKDYVSKESNWIIADVRYINEAETIKRLGGIVIRVNRPMLNEDNHISETQLDNYDRFNYIINNNQSLEDYHNKITDLYNKLVK